MELKKVWCMRREGKGEISLSLYETREETIEAAIKLHPVDRGTIAGIYEAMAGVDAEGNYVELWSEDFPELATIAGIPGGEEVSLEEVEEIEKYARNWR